MTTWTTPEWAGVEGAVEVELPPVMMTTWVNPGESGGIQVRPEGYNPHPPSPPGWQGCQNVTLTGGTA